jgi:hypothetical protein
MPLTLRNKAETLFWKRHEKILGDEDTEEEHPRYSNFSFDEGSGMASEEELDPEEHPHIYYDPDEDAFFYQPADILNDTDGPKRDSDASGILLRTFDLIHFYQFRGRNFYKEGGL